VPGDPRGGARLDDVRPHDLRHAFASAAASSGMGLPIIGMLWHSRPATTARYAHLASDPVKAAAAAVAGKIAAAMAGRSGKTGKSSSPVLPRRYGA
jgi:integrase